MMNREKLAEQIAGADIPTGDKELLILRLHVASHEGCAAIVREFEGAMTKRRKACLASHRRFFEGRGSAPFDKRMVMTSFKIGN
jgi:hypothetical protein